MELFLDSGAFSAKTRGVVIDIDEYIQFIKDHINEAHIFSNLDVIGDGQASYENWERMSNAKVPTLPVYHLGTDISYLKKYISKSEYIAIGGMAKMSNKKRVFNLDYLWEEYLTPSGIKVHGFGMTSYPLLLRYPWHSVDSTGWFRHAIYGKIIIPYSRNGKWVYDRSPWVVSVSARSGGINDQPPTLIKLILQYIEEQGFKLGSTNLIETGGTKGFFGNSKVQFKEEILEAGLENDASLRTLLNCLYILNFLFSTSNSIQRFFLAGGISSKEALTELFNKRCPSASSRTGLLVSYVEGSKVFNWASHFVDAQLKKEKKGE